MFIKHQLVLALSLVGLLNSTHAKSLNTTEKEMIVKYDAEGYPIINGVHSNPSYGKSPESKSSEVKNCIDINGCRPQVGAPAAPIVVGPQSKMSGEKKVVVEYNEWGQVVDSVNNPIQSPMPNPKQSPMQSLMQSSIQGPMQGPMQSPMQNPMHNPKQNSIENTMPKTEQHSVVKPVKVNTTNPPKENSEKQPVLFSKKTKSKKPKRKCIKWKKVKKCTKWKKKVKKCVKYKKVSKCVKRKRPTPSKNSASKTN